MFIGTGIYLVCTIKLGSKERLKLWQIVIVFGSVFLTYAFMMTIFTLIGKWLDHKSLTVLREIFHKFIAIFTSWLSTP